MVVRLSTWTWLETPVGELTWDRLRARPGGRHPARAEHDLRLRARRPLGLPTSATSASRPCATEQAAAAIGSVDLLFLPVGGGPTIDAGQAAEIVSVVRPRWVVPMHYRTPRIGFLEPPDGFLERMPEVHRVEGTAFETDDLPTADGPLAVVPAAP